MFGKKFDDSLELHADGRKFMYAMQVGDRANTVGDVLASMPKHMAGNGAVALELTHRGDRVEKTVVADAGLRLATLQEYINAVGGIRKPTLGLSRVKNTFVISSTDAAEQSVCEVRCGEVTALIGFENGASVASVRARLATAMSLADEAQELVIEAEDAPTQLVADSTMTMRDVVAVQHQNGFRTARLVWRPLSAPSEAASFVPLVAVPVVRGITSRGEAVALAPGLVEITEAAPQTVTSTSTSAPAAAAVVAPAVAVAGAEVSRTLKVTHKGLTYRFVASGVVPANAGEFEAVVRPAIEAKFGAGAAGGVFYRDTEGDRIRVTCALEWEEVLRVMAAGAIKLEVD